MSNQQQDNAADTNNVPMLDFASLYTRHWERAASCGESKTSRKPKRSPPRRFRGRSRTGAASAVKRRSQRGYTPSRFARSKIATDGAAISYRSTTPTTGTSSRAGFHGGPDRGFASPRKD